jgi:hypothetical protein
MPEAILIPAMIVFSGFLYWRLFTPGDIQ